ncbi:MAG: glycosyltransferase family 4 protein [Deltaproteobacteria bacterium]|nr:glycosyltransferase family 4 protein [Deltaproteobacteria bacterium]MBI4223749.1 glycosyltransferase family 4 protein [Deltaproteobacteria bacterium]
MKKPRILFFLHLPPPVHGVTVLNANIVQSSALRGAFDVKILPISYSQNIEGIGRFSLRKIFKTIVLFGRLTHRLLRFRPQLVYFSIVPAGIFFYRDAVFTWWMKLFRKPVLFHLHGLGVEESIRGPLSRRIYRRTFQNSSVIQQSSLLAFDLRKVEADIRKIYVVPNAVPRAEEPRRVKRPGNPLVFIHLSTILPAKGQMDIVQAARRLLDQRVDAFKVILAGQVYDSGYASRIENFVREAGLNAHVEIIGGLFGREKERALAEGDVFLFPSRREVFGLVVIEAMRAGLPVIAANVGSLPEIVEAGAGFLYPPGDVEKLAGHMTAFINNPDAAASMGQRAADTFERKFTFEVFERKMRDVFLDVLRSATPDIFPRPRD